MTFSPTSTMPGLSVTLNWANETNFPNSWIGLYPTGANDYGFIAGLYLNCNSSTPPGSAPASTGSCSLTIPNTASPGSYSLKLYDCRPSVSGPACNNRDVASGLTITAAPVLTNVSISPKEGTGLSQSFTFTWTDSAGISDSPVGWFEFTPNTTSGNFANSCTGHINFGSSSSQFVILNNAGTNGVGQMTIGSAGTMENDQCSVNVGAITLGPTTGTTFSATVPITFKTAFTGMQNSWIFAQGAASSFAPWSRPNLPDTWAVPPVITCPYGNPTPPCGYTGNVLIPLNPPYQIMTQGNTATTFDATSTGNYALATYVPGLSIDTNTGIISGTPTRADTYDIKLIAKKGQAIGTAVLHLSIVAPSICNQ
jgi:hypothetical protein